MPITLDRKKIDEALSKVAPGLAKYLRIMAFVAKDPRYYDDPDFRRAFNGFYRVRRSAQTWQPQFFALMARAKAQNFDFPRTLFELFAATGRVQDFRGSARNGGRKVPRRFIPDGLPEGGRHGRKGARPGSLADPLIRIVGMNGPGSIALIRKELMNRSPRRSRRMATDQCVVGHFDEVGVESHDLPPKPLGYAQVAVARIIIERVV